MFEQIGVVLAGATAERERTSVRRQSRARGRCEGVFWRRTNRQDVLLNDYLAQHKDATDYLRRASRLHYGSIKIGPYMQRTFNDDQFSQNRLDTALLDLDALTRSPEWMKESERNKRAAERSQTPVDVD